MLSLIPFFPLIVCYLAAVGIHGSWLPTGGQADHDQDQG